MGNCFGSCLPTTSNKTDSNLDFNLLIDENPSVLFRDYKKRSFLERLFLKTKSRKRLKVQKPVLELVDGILNTQISSSYSRLNESSQQFLPSTSSYYSNKDIPLQCLDARALMSQTAASTPQHDSIDLEWEHETLLPSSSLVHDTSGSSWTAVAEDDDLLLTDSSTHHAECNSEESCSRVSSANSLEWDNVQQAFIASPVVSEIDSDTQVLLKEIERLTWQTLSETGKELFS